MTVAVLSTEDRHYSRCVQLFSTEAQAERAVVDLLHDEYGERVGTYDAAAASLRDVHGWSIHIDVCEMPVDTDGKQ